MQRYATKIPEWPEDERPRERLVKFGAESLSDAELLGIVLRTGNAKSTAIDLARHLISKFGGLRGIDSKSVEELCQVNGIGSAKAAQIKAALEIAKRFSRESSKISDRIANSNDVYQVVRLRMRDLPREEFRALFLTGRNDILAEKTIFEGSLTESVVSAREIIREAVNYCAAAVIFLHNHPSGDPSPSAEDQRVTQKLKTACEAADIQVLDHVIIGKDDYYSFESSEFEYFNLSYLK